MPTLSEIRQQVRSHIDEQTSRFWDDATELDVSPLTANQYRLFWLKVRWDPSGCWLWEGNRTPTGYGLFGYWRGGDKPYGTLRVHKQMYRWFVGEVPEGLELDHLCRSRNCVNPAHLEAVTHLENVRRGQIGHIHRSKTHCPKGHPYDEVNTLWVRTPRGTMGRQCRECSREQTRVWRQKNPQSPQPRKQRVITHCPKGHVYDAQNTYFTLAGHRKCRTCRREGMADVYQQGKLNANIG